MAGGDDVTNESAPQSLASTKNHAVNEHAAQDEPATNGETEVAPVTNGDNAEAQASENVFQLNVKLPHPPGQIQQTVSTQEQMQDIRQGIIDTPGTFQYSCFHLEHNGKRINDFIELGEVAGIAEEPEVTLVEDPYTETQARLHFVRVRELIGAAGDRTDLVHGLDAGLSLVEGIGLSKSEAKDEASPVADHDLNATGSVSSLLPKPSSPAPKTVKAISLSPWNPPPHQLRMRGHLLYLQVTTNEGEQHSITSHVSGFFVNKSTNQKFDPAPRTSPKSFSAHSMISLLAQISPSFEAQFKKLQEFNGRRDPLASYSLSNCIPAAPWMIQRPSTQSHQSDLARTQEQYLLSGADNAETMRDWNEELQSTRELPKESVQERVFRERLTSKLFAEYNEAAVRGAVLVARGEVQPLNPTEARDAQIFVYNNVFYSFGADGVGTFASDGGDEAARIATGKDVQGVKAVNQLDVSGLFTPGTVVVDYLGKRVVGQSIVPGIFKPREAGEHQIDYGGVEGKDVIATHESFEQPFAELSKATRVKKHAVWDKDGKKHLLEASVETKGLLGTDGRKYVLDLYRITPLDVAWVEAHRGDDQTEESRYPHRMTVLRPELVESYRMMRLRESIGKELEKMREAGVDAKPESEEMKGDSEEAKSGESSGSKQEGQNKEQEAVDVSSVSFTLNPDVFCGQQPQTEEEKAEWEEDEKLVRAVCSYLTSEVMPRLIHQLQEGDAGFPMDGASLVSLMHKRGINVRYLGELWRLAGEQPQDRRRVALRALCVQEMVARAFKHATNKQLRTLAPPFAQAAVSHMLNCLLGGELNAEPQAELDDELRALYPESTFDFTSVTPESLAKDLRRQIYLRYRVQLPENEELVAPTGKVQMLREVCLKLGLQLDAKEYQFSKEQHTNGSPPETNGVDSPNGAHTNGIHATSDGENAGPSKKKNKKKKAGQEHVANGVAAAHPPKPSPTTFRPEDVINTVPMVKEASPKSVLAEEALEAGRMSIQQDQRELGQELLLESLSLHEQIYGILHPEVARMYYTLSTLFYSLDEKPSAVELAKKAVIVAERTLGVDNSETLLAYLNLSLFEHATGNTRQALLYVRHALELWKVVYGRDHPDSITTLNNAAVMLQSIKLFHDSRIWFEESLRICEGMSGRGSINAATLLFQLAQALALDHEGKEAVKTMRESYTIFKQELGADNQNTKEAEQWLETLTHSAVSQAKQANALLQNRRILLRSGRGSRIAIPGTTRTQASSVTTGAAAPLGTGLDGANEQVPAGASGVDRRSVDELLRYINGETGSKQGTPKKKAAANPTRRKAGAKA